MNATPTGSAAELLVEAKSNDSTAENASLEFRGVSAEDTFNAIEEIHLRAETITSLLREILEFHPMTHWEVKE